MRTGVAAIAAASAIALGAGLMAPPAPAQAASQNIAGGIALDPEGVLDGLGAGWAYNGLSALGLLGATNSIAVLPVSVAATFAGPGESATAFSIVGLALASTDIDVAIVTLQSGQVTCAGGLTYAHSSTEGRCLNVVGVLLADQNSSTDEISLGLVNPLGVLEVLNDPTGVVGEFASQILSGDSRALQNLLTPDFVRLSFSPGNRVNEYGLPNFLSVTSAYGFIDPIKVNWLGQELTIFPTTPNPGNPVASDTRPNYIALPYLKTGSFNVSQFLPSFQGLSFDNFRFPFIGDLGSSTSTMSTLAAASTPAATPFANMAKTPSAADTTAPPAVTTPQVPSAVKLWRSDTKQAWQSNTSQMQQNWAERQQQRRETTQQRTQQWRSTWQQNQPFKPQARQGADTSSATQGGTTSQRPSFGSGWKSQSVPKTSFGGSGATRFGGSAAQSGGAQN